MSIAKRISDPVHGTVGLTSVEVDLINTSAFQRLRNVKQLGLAHYVFPGADYSRFAHSVGVCHVTGKILDALNRVISKPLRPKEVQKYRIAALLHDIGHYPFSHATEIAISNHYSEPLFRRKAAPIPGSKGILTRMFKHERVSKEILLKDSSIKTVLANHGIKPEEISSIFLRENQSQFVKLISSDLDADRIDYLLRTAHHTGLPYGSVDIDYILSQICQDQKGRICVSSKALRAADHFLLCRYFDYQQVTYHKSVVGFELVLKDVITSLLKNSLIDCSAPSISHRIQSGEWTTFDDILMFSEIRSFSTKTKSKIDQTKALSILNRFPPKLLAENELLQRRDMDSLRDFHGRLQAVKEKIPSWAKLFKIDKRLWYWWTSNMDLTKSGSQLPISSIEQDSSDNRGKLEQAIRILGGDKKSSQPIMEVPHSLMKILSDHACYTIRVYALLPHDKKQLASSISEKIRLDLSNIAWK